MRAFVLSITIVALMFPAVGEARPKKIKRSAPAKATAKAKAKVSVKAKVRRKKRGPNVTVVPMTITATPQKPLFIAIPVKSRRYTRPDLQLKREAYRQYR